MTGALVPGIRNLLRHSELEYNTKLLIRLWRPDLRKIFFFSQPYSISFCSFHDRHGRFSLKYRPQWNNVEDCMHLCLASLDENDRQKMNGELVGSAMIYQDVLNGGTKQLQSIIGSLNFYSIVQLSRLLLFAPVMTQ